jgi:hypothetical protein
MQNFNQIISSVKDNVARRIVREMFLKIKNGRPNFGNV